MGTFNNICDLAVGSDWELPHLLSSCESYRFLIPSFIIIGEMQMIRGQSGDCFFSGDGHIDPLNCMSY